MSPPAARPPFLWRDLRAPDLAALDLARAVAVLPVAAVEQHGPHLPLGTDAAIMEGHLALVAARLAADPSSPLALCLPTQEVGASLEHEAVAGTLSLPPAAAGAAWLALARGARRAGVRRLVIVSSHGGNNEVAALVARELRARDGMLVVPCSWSRFGYPDGLFPDAERRHGVHGGTVETSLMLAFRPDLVAMERAARFASLGEALEREAGRLRASGPLAFSWMAGDLNPSGVVGDAAAATAEAGRAAAAHAAEGFVDLLRDVAAFDLARLASQSVPAPSPSSAFS